MKRDLFVAIFYRNFKHHHHKHSHVGLGVGSLHIAKMLRRNGIPANVYGIWTAEDIRQTLKKLPEVTHVIIQAPWASAADVGALAAENHAVSFAVVCHSQVGFLQVEAGAVKLIREYLMLQDESLNFRFASNSKHFKMFVERAYNTACQYLPNMYDAVRPNFRRKHQDSSLIRVGSFGAIRLLKNHATAAAAALELARKRGTDLEFWISTQREEHGKGVLQMIQNMFYGLEWARVVENPWQNWAAFKHTVGHMDINMQVSATETFNIVSADSVAEGVPVVGSESIEWLPKDWIACIDNVSDIARVANNLLNDGDAAEDGFEALQDYMDEAVRAWVKYITCSEDNTL